MHTLGRTVGRPAGGDLFEQIPTAVVVLFTLLLPGQHRTTRAGIRCGRARRNATGDTAAVQAPTVGCPIGIGLRRGVWQRHLGLRETLKIAVVVVGVIVVILVAPIVALALAMTTARGLGTRNARVDVAQEILVAPGRTDPIGGRCAALHDLAAPVFVVGGATDIRRVLDAHAREAGTIQRVVIVGPAIGPPGIAMGLHPGNTLVPPSSIVEIGDVVLVEALRPEVTRPGRTAVAGSGPIGTTVRRGGRVAEQVGVVLPFLGVGDGDHRRVETGAVGALLGDLAQRQIARRAGVLIGIGISHRLRSALVVGENVLMQEVALHLHLDIIEHIGAHDFGRDRATGAGKIRRVIAARGATAAAAATVEQMGNTGAGIKMDIHPGIPGRTGRTGVMT